MKTEGWRLYQKIAVVFLTCLLLFIALNVVSLAIIKIKKGRTNDKSWSILQTDFKIIYPKLNPDEIKAIWKETAARSSQYDPYTQFRERPYQGKYIQVDQQGFRHTKNQAPWPPGKDQFNIFFFGGSTGFGWGLPSEETIASHLQDFFLADAAGPQVHIYNFSQAAFFSTQERILLEQLIISGFQPDMAIFFDGLNECSLNTPLYTEHLKLYFDGKISSPFSQLPLVKVFRKIKEQILKSRQTKPESGLVSEMIVERYLANQKLIEKISEGYGIKTVFVWQPVPFYQYDLKLNPFYQYDLKSNPFTDEHILLQVRSKRAQSVYPKMEALFKEGTFGENFLWLAGIQQNSNKLLYVDQVHYSGEMSQSLASFIHRFIKDQIQNKNQTTEANPFASVKTS